MSRQKKNTDNNRMSRRAFLGTGLSAGLTMSMGTSFIGTSYAAPSQRPNVLFIAIEDLSPHRLGVYGNQVCRTPVMDRFTAEGLRFNAAYCSGPVCNPSRSSMLSGLRPETTGILGNQYDWRKILKPGTTLPEHFERNGYTTIKIGKMFHGGTRDEHGQRIEFHDADRWTRVIDENEGLPPVTRKTNQLMGQLDVEERNKELLAQGKPRLGTSFRFGPTGQPDWEHVDGRIAEQATRILAGDQQEPFFLAVGFHAPHLAFTAPDKYFGLYPSEKISLPYNPPGDLDDTPLTIGKDHLKTFHDESMWKKAIAAQYATATFVDAQIGRILNALEYSGRAKDTIVVIWSDHGFQLGEHFCWRKGEHFEHSTRVILLMKAPGITMPGSVCERPVESIDLYPTLCDVCGIPVPDDLEGISMRPLLLDPSRPWKKGVLISGSKAKTIRTERWRYTEYRDSEGGVELYDHHTDPGEYTNVAGDPCYVKEIRNLSDLLHKGWKACLPD